MKSSSDSYHPFSLNVFSEEYSFNDLKEASPHLDRMGVTWRNARPASWGNQLGVLSFPIGIRDGFLCHGLKNKGVVLNLMDFYIGDKSDVKRT
jgi:hypothetical protein